MPKIAFKIGFWHPFGIHAGEAKDKIIKRKKEEIRNNGWTFWSFQLGAEEKLKQWRTEIKKHGQRVFVLCSDSKNATDPTGECFLAKEFKEGEDWKKIPSDIEIPHPFGKKQFACAFKVRAIYDKEEFKIPLDITWYCVHDLNWRDDNLPTRGEYLIKIGGNSKLRDVSSVLELEYPYVTIIKK
jgi:hypothetical protein